MVTVPPPVGVEAMAVRAAEAVVAERGGLARLPRIGDADEPVLGVPGVIAQPVRSDIAVGVESERLAGQVGELVEVVVARGLRELSWAQLSSSDECVCGHPLSMCKSAKSATLMPMDGP